MKVCGHRFALRPGPNPSIDVNVRKVRSGPGRWQLVMTVGQGGTNMSNEIWTKLLLDDPVSTQTSPLMRCRRNYFIRTVYCDGFETSIARASVTVAMT
jgi:hypothetical protein